MITRDPSITAALHGQAVRDARPRAEGAPFPLVIISHGYPGNRHLLHLGENLASKGYVVVSIDHKDSTDDDQKDAVWAVDREGRTQPEHTYWKGFKRGTAVGLVLEHRAPQD